MWPAESPLGPRRLAGLTARRTTDRLSPLPVGGRVLRIRLGSSGSRSGSAPCSRGPGIGVRLCDLTPARAAGAREVLLVSAGAAMSAVPITIATRGGLRPGIDLAVYLEAGRAVAHGWPLYSLEFGHDLSTPLPFTYPPGAAALVAAVAWVPQWVCFVALSLASLGVLGWLVVATFDDAIARLSPDRPALAWVIAGVWAGRHGARGQQPVAGSGQHPAGCWGVRLVPGRAAA